MAIVRSRGTLILKQDVSRQLAWIVILQRYVNIVPFFGIEATHVLLTLIFHHQRTLSSTWWPINWVKNLRQYAARHSCRLHARDWPTFTRLDQTEEFSHWFIAARLPYLINSEPEIDKFWILRHARLLVWVTTRRIVTAFENEIFSGCICGRWSVNHSPTWPLALCIDAKSLNMLQH